MGFLERGLLLYLGIAIALCFAAPQVIFTSGSTADNSVLGWFNMGYNETDGSVYSITSSNSFSTTANSSSTSFTSGNTPEAGGLLGFLDPVFQVFGWIGLIFKVLFSPVVLLTGDAMAGAPTMLFLIIAIPIVFMTLFGLIAWIRGGVV